MTRIHFTLAVAAAAALAGCDTSDQTLTQGGPADPMANELANAAPVTLPPSILSSHPYRCKDNSLIFVDWMSDGSARVKKERGEVGTTVAVGGENPVLTGDAQASTITYNGQSCSR